MLKDLLNTYKLGWKTSYYQNTYDFKGEEETVQPQGIDDTVEADQKSREEFANDSEYEEYCDACAI
jgi:ribonucleoside-diphosphate reductase alpha chain